MAQPRYLRLQTIGNDFYYLDAPVEIEKGALLLDTQTNSVLLQLRLNILKSAPSKISSVSILVRGLDDAGHGIVDLNPMGYIYRDVYLLNTDAFGDNGPFILDPRIRKVSVIINNVTYVNGEFWQPSREKVTPPKQQEFSSLDPNLTVQLSRETSLFNAKTRDQLHFIPEQLDNYWLCACGRPNGLNADKCARCGLEKATIFNLTREHLQKNLEIFNEQQRKIEEVQARKKAEEQAKIAEKRRILNKRMRVILPLVGALISLFALFYYVILPAINYSTAANHLTNKNYDSAIYMFTALGKYKNSEEMVLEANYQKANDLLTKSMFEESSKIFSDLNNYRDSSTLIHEVDFRKATDLLNNKEFDSARLIFINLGDYRTSKEMAMEAIYQNGMDLISKGEYAEAVNLFKSILDYKDTRSLIPATVYQNGTDLISKGNFDEAITLFNTIPDYKDARLLRTTAIYQKAKGLFDSKQFDAAITEFSKIIDYEDSKGLIKEATYQEALRSYSTSEYQKAVKYFTGLADYKDSSSYIPTIYEKGTQKLNAGEFPQAANIFKALGDYQDSAKFLKIAQLNRSDPKTVINVISEAIKSRNLDTFATFVPEAGLFYTNFYEGGMNVTKEAFLKDLQDRLTSQISCYGVEENSDVTIWYSNWSPAWKMDKMCYGECWNLSPIWYSNYAGMQFTLESGAYHLKGLILKEPSIFYGDLFTTPKLMSCTNYPNCKGAPQTRLSVGMRAQVCTEEDPVLVRWSPGKSGDKLTSLNPGATVKIIGGPECAGNNWTWWEVELPSGLTGWMTEGGDAIEKYYLCPLY